MNRPSNQVFVEMLTRFAVELANPQIAAIAAGMAAPLQVAVAGRRGVGRRTVASALECIGLTVVPDRSADLVVYVIAEVAKPEDSAALAALASCAQPVLVVMNKSDLTARATAAAGVARLAAPAQPLAALLAVAVLNDRLGAPLWAALQILTSEPADFSCSERFATAPHSLSPQLRQQLCDTIDLPGISHAVAALRQGWPVAQVGALLRRLSGIDAVARRVTAIGAAVRYRRLLHAVAQLEALAVNDSRISDFLSCDDTVVARMAAALPVVEAAGLGRNDADPADASTRLRQAARWQCLSGGPIAAVHQACGADIARALLRLWSNAAKKAQEPV